MVVDVLKPRNCWNHKKINHLNISSMNNKVTAQLKIVRVRMITKIEPAGHTHCTQYLGSGANIMIKARAVQSESDQSANLPPPPGHCLNQSE